MTGTPFTHIKTSLNLVVSRENVFDMYGDFCKNATEIVAVVLIFSAISSDLLKSLCIDSFHMGVGRSTEYKQTKEPYKRDDILQKRPISLIEATPYASCVCSAAGIPSAFVLTSFEYVRQDAFIWACVGQPKTNKQHYKVATISRLLQITGLFCKRAL